MRISARRTALTIIWSTLLGACAAGSRSGAPAKSASPAAEPPASASGRAAPGDKFEESTTAAPPPPPAAQPTTPGQNAYAPRPDRAVAMSHASNEIEASQRELDVAGGDCRNACRALGSMDRAAGRLCGLAQSNDEQQRCGEAKTRVYGARDKVRNTCGSCPDVSVERNAPIPSH